MLVLGGLSPFNMERGTFNTSKTFDQNNSGLLMLRYNGGNDVFVWIIDKWAVKNLGKEYDSLSVTVSNGIVTVSSTASLPLKYALIKI